MEGEREIILQERDRMRTEEKEIVVGTRKNENVPCTLNENVQVRERERLKMLKKENVWQKERDKMRVQPRVRMCEGEKNWSTNSEICS